MRIGNLFHWADLSPSNRIILYGLHPADYKYSLDNTKDKKQKKTEIWIILRTHKED